MTSPRSSMRASRLPGSNRCRWESRRGSRSGASGRPEAERRAVHAIALAGRLRPVVEDMPQMPAAAPAMHLGARIAKLAVGRGRDGALQRRPETRPAGMAFEFGLRSEEHTSELQSLMRTSYAVF